MLLIPVFRKFFVRYPDIQLTLGASDRVFDFIGENILGLDPHWFRGGADKSIRFYICFEFFAIEEEHGLVDIRRCGRSHPLLAQHLCSLGA